jgi:hypothetical protein
VSVAALEILKKILLASIAAACAFPRFAYADATVDLSGSWEGGVMIANISDADRTKLTTGVGDSSEPISKDTRSSNFFQDTEVVVTATSELSSGWTASAIIEFENNPNRDYDHGEIFVRFSHGSVGDLELGNRDMAGYRMVPQAVSAGFEPNGGAGNRITNGLAVGELWSPLDDTGNANPVPVSARNILTLEDIGLPTAPSGAGTGDSTKISYITPRVYGLQIGLSYAPDACEAGVAVNGPNKCSAAGTGLESNSDLAFAGGAFGDAWGVAANQAIPLEMLGLEADGLVLVGAGYYKSLLEQGTLATSLSKLHIGGQLPTRPGTKIPAIPTDANYFIGDGYTEWNIGALLKVSDFKVSGAYRTGDLGAAAPEISTYQVGTTYALGAWEFGVNYAHGEAKRPTKAAAQAAVAAYNGTIKSMAGANPALANYATLSKAEAIFAINASTYSFGGTDTMNAWELAANYDLGPGVKLIGAVRHYDAEQGLGAAAGTYEKTIVEIGSKINF